MALTNTQGIEGLTAAGAQDQYGLEGQRQAIIMLAGDIRRNALAGSDLLPFLLEDLDESLVRLSGAMVADGSEDTLHAVIPHEMTVRTSRWDNVLEDYETGESGRGHGLQIPIAAITQAKALRFGYSESHDYSPVVDARIKTSKDPVPKVYGREPEVSQGLWYRLPLATVKLVRLPAPSK